MLNQSSDPRAALLKYAANILNQRPYLSPKLSQKLYDRAEKLKLGDVKEVIEKIIADLSNQGYLNDEYLIEAKVRQLLNKGYGPRYIKAKLRFLKIPEATISDQIKLLDQAQLIAAARVFLNKKRYDDQRKSQNALFQRGFDFQTINKVFDSSYVSD